MRILLDENIPGDAVATLRSRGHDVVWIRTDSPGIADDAILAGAVSEQRLLITFDKDFGELVFRRDSLHHAGWYCSELLPHLRRLLPKRSRRCLTVVRTGSDSFRSSMTVAYG